MFVRMAGVVRMTGLGRSTIYRLMAYNGFPSPVRLAKRVVDRYAQRGRPSMLVAIRRRRCRSRQH